MNKVGFLIVGVLIGILVMLPFTLHAPSQDPKSRMPNATNSQASAVSFVAVNFAHIVRAVDGDTLVIKFNDKEDRVRILGINAPESVDPDRPVQCFGPEASKRMHELADKKIVTLIRGDEDRDAYGRLLRFVEVDGTDIGAEMISGGYAENYCDHFPHPRCSEYDVLQKTASEAKVGMWGACR